MDNNVFTITITGDTAEHLQQNMRDMLPSAPLTDFIREMDFQSLLLRVDERCEIEGYEIEVYKKGERPEPELPLAERKKAEARARLRGDLIDSLAEATHATSVVKEEIEAEAETPPAPETKPKKTAKGNGKGAKTPETPEALKARMILRLQELYSEGRKADVNKLLATHGNGVKTFSAIPASEFGPIAEAVEAL